MRGANMGAKNNGERACTCSHCGNTFTAAPTPKHRLVCGDSTIPADVDRAMDGQAAAVCLTDPPYGLGETVSTKNEYVEYEDSKDNLVRLIAGFLPLAQKAARIVVLTPGNSNQRLYPPQTWTMAWFVPAGTGRGPWGFICWQPILCYGKDPKLATGQGSHPDAIVHTESAEKNGHACPKPVKFWSWLMERVSEEGDLVFDAFMGSGTTMIAAELTGRRSCGIELSPQYVDLCVRRWMAHVGKEAVLEGDGRTFSVISKERLP